MSSAKKRKPKQQQKKKKEGQQQDKKHKLASALADAADSEEYPSFESQWKPNLSLVCLGDVEPLKTRWDTLGRVSPFWCRMIRDHRLSHPDLNENDGQVTTLELDTSGVTLSDFLFWTETKMLTPDIDQSRVENLMHLALKWKADALLPDLIRAWDIEGVEHLIRTYALAKRIEPLGQTLKEKCTEWARDNPKACIAMLVTKANMGVKCSELAYLMDYDWGRTRKQWAELAAMKQKCPHEPAEFLQLHQNGRLKNYGLIRSLVTDRGQPCDEESPFSSVKIGIVTIKPDFKAQCTACQGLVMAVPDSDDDQREPTDVSEAEDGSSD